VDLPDAMLHQERSGSTVRCDLLQRMEAQDAMVR